MGNSPPKRLISPPPELDRLPLHIIDQIILYLPPAPLNALSQTCQLFAHMATPILYRDIRITSAEMMARLIGERFSRRPAFSHTRRLTQDCPCDNDFRLVVQAWNTQPRSEEGVGDGGPLFVDVDKVVFAAGWMRSLTYDGWLVIHNAARQLRNLANPLSICFYQQADTVSNQGAVMQLVEDFSDLWSRVRSIYCHGAGEPVWLGLRGHMLKDRPMVFTIYDTLPRKNRYFSPMNYWESLKLRLVLLQSHFYKGMTIRIVMRGATHTQKNREVAQVKKGIAGFRREPRLGDPPEVAGQEDVDGAPPKILISSAPSACAACEVLA